MNSPQAKSLDEHALDVIKGFLNYYLQFAGKYHTLITRLCECRGTEEALLLGAFLDGPGMRDELRFRSPTRGQVVVYSDATPSKLAAIVLCDEAWMKLKPRKLLAKLKSMKKRPIGVEVLESRTRKDLPIIEAEIRALLLGLKALELKNIYHRYQVVAHTDSMSTLYFIKKGSSNYKLWDSRVLIELLAERNRLAEYFDIKILYINTKANPADFYSRLN
jgi:hypothetical protein